MKSCINSRKLPFVFAALALGFCAPSAFAVTAFTLSDAQFSHTQSVSANAFADDTFSFTLNMSAGGATIDLSSTSFGDAQIQFFDALGNDATVGYSFPTVAVASGPFATTPYLVNGDYAARISSSTSFNGNLTMEVTPVPEADQWAMMLAGMGLIGLQLRRRSGN